MPKPPDPNAPRIGRALYNLRRSRGLPQADLAADVGLSQPVLSRLERGRAHLDLATIAKLAGRFEMELPALVSLLYAEPPATAAAPKRKCLGPDELRVNLYWVRLNAKEKRMVDRLSGQLGILCHAVVLREGLYALYELVKRDSGDVDLATIGKSA